MSINSRHQINLEKLFLELSQVFNGNSEIEKISSQELRAKAKAALTVTEENPLSDDITSVMRADDAHPICSEILKTPFNWVPPETSNSDLYKKHSHFKAHVELLGPDGLVKSNIVRLGLYGMQSPSEYRIRSHPAEEIYVMLAGGCCQTNEPKHQYSFDEYFYEITTERHSVRAASRLSLNVLRFESDLCELNRL